MHSQYFFIARAFFIRRLDLLQAQLEVLPCRMAQEGNLLHNVLPRTLQALSESGNLGHSEDFKAELEDLLQDEVVNADVANDDWESWLLNLSKVGDLSPAEVNQKRKQLTFSAFRQPEFAPRTMLLEYLMYPLLSGMDSLLTRSGLLARLHHMPDLKLDAQESLRSRPGSCNVAEA